MKTWLGFIAGFVLLTAVSYAGARPRVTGGQQVTGANVVSALAGQNLAVNSLTIDNGTATSVISFQDNNFIYMTNNLRVTGGNGIRADSGNITAGAGGFVAAGKSTLTPNFGSITLSTGTGTATVTSGATCVCTDSTANASVRCSVTTTTLTATGTGSDVIKYFCDS